MAAAQIYAVLTAPYFCTVLWKACVNISCRQLHGGRAVAQWKHMSHPFRNHSVFSTRTHLCSWPSVVASLCLCSGAQAAFRWGLVSWQEEQGAPRSSELVCLASCLCPGAGSHRASGGSIFLVGSGICWALSWWSRDRCGTTTIFWVVDGGSQMLLGPKKAWEEQLPATCPGRFKLLRSSNVPLEWHQPLWQHFAHYKMSRQAHRGVLI